MSGTTELRDAKITLRIDTAAARRELEELRRDTDRRKKREGEKSEKDDKRRGEKREKEKKGGLAIVPGSLKGGAARAVRSLATAFILKKVFEVLPGFVDEAIETRFGKDSVVAKMVQETVSDSMRKVVNVVDKASNLATSAAGVVGDATDFAASQRILTGEAQGGDIVDAVTTGYRLRVVEKEIANTKRRLGNEALGRSGVNVLEQVVGSRFHLNK